MTATNDAKAAPSMSMSAEAPVPTAETQAPINATPYADPQYSVPAIMAALYGDGILGLKGAFPREWAARMNDELTELYKEALSRPGGAVGRGTNRHYVEIHPEDISGFLDLVTHPWVRTVCECVLGPNYKVVEIGFDVPNPGARDQPWHRDFRAGEETLLDRRLNSLAFNLTAVDVEEDMGPFEIAPGTQWDDPSEYDHGMFPPTSLYPRYRSLAQRKYPRAGDISVRSALTIHRGTANTSRRPRPVLVLGVDAPGAGHDEWHDLQFTRAYYDALPQEVRDHLICRVVDELEPIVQGHTIEGLMMGDA